MEEQTFQTLAESCYSCGKFNEALRSFNLLKKTHRENKNDSGLYKVDVQIAQLFYLRGDYDEVFKVCTKVLKNMEKYSEEYTDEIFEVKCYIANVYSRKMKKDLAGKIYDELREFVGKLPTGNPKTTEFKNNLAMSLKQSGEFQEALDMFEEVYHERIATHGETSNVTEYSYGEKGIMYLDMGRYKKALDTLEKVHNAFTSETIEEISYLRLKRYLADAHMYLRLVKIAEDLYGSIINETKDKLPYHPEVLFTMHNWGRSLAKLKKCKDALLVLNEVYTKRCEESPKHPDTARIALDIATVYLNAKDYSNALITFLQELARTSSDIKWNPDLLLHSMASIASILNASEDTDVKEQVLKMYQYVYEKQIEKRGLLNVHKDTLQTRIRIVELLLSLQKPDGALEVLKDVLEKRTMVLKNNYIDCIDVLKNIAKAYYNLNQYVEAFEYYSEVYEIQKLITGENSVEAVEWDNKLREITSNKIFKSKTVLIDAVVSSYRTRIKGSAESENVNMEDNFPLHIASETGRLAMLKFLLFQGAIYNEKNSEGKTPADVACCEAVKILFNLIDSLFFAVRRTDCESIDRILDVMNDTSLEDDSKGFPILLTGFEKIRDITDKTLLNARDETGSTALHLACRNGDQKTVKRLLELEVDLTLTDKNNKSPRDVAEDKMFTEILQCLDSYVLKKKEDLEDSTISQKNPEMPEDIMDQQS